MAAASFHRHGTGRPQKRYAVTAAALQPTGGRSYRLLAELLTEALGPGEDGSSGSPEVAGAAWAHAHSREFVHQPDPDATDEPTHEPGDVPRASSERTRDPALTPGGWLGKVARVVDLLTAWGYGASVHTTDGGRTAVVELTACPFLDLASEHVNVVCAAHRGLLRGALEVLGEPDAGVDLTPFVAPTQCEARLTAGRRLSPPRPRLEDLSSGRSPDLPDQLTRKEPA